MNETTKPRKTPANEIRKLRARIAQLDDMRTLQHKMYGDFPECEMFKAFAADIMKIRAELSEEWKKIVW